MSTGNPYLDPKSTYPNVGEKIKSAQEVEWEQKRAQIDDIIDATGRGIDEGIKDTVTALNVNGISTSASCEGHFEVKGHRPWPWVTIAEPDEPEQRFTGEAQAFLDASIAHGISLEQLRRGHPEELYWGIQEQISQNPETSEYKEWAVKNKELHQKITRLLNEFYSDREVDADIKIKAEEFTDDVFEIGSVTERELRLRFFGDELSNEEERELLDKLPRRQKEMTDFTDFLKARFLRKKENILEKAIELVENSTLDSESKLELTLLLLDKKQGVQLGDFKIVESDEEKKKVTAELAQKMTYITKLLDSLSLEHGIAHELSDDDGMVGFSVLASKDRSTLNRFIQADKEGDDKTFGSILGFPPTAVETYGTDAAFDFRTELPPEDLEKLRAEGMLPFLLFSPSREHWAEELEWARENQRLVKERAPKLYSELLQTNQKPKETAPSKTSEGPNRQQREVEDAVKIQELRERLDGLFDKE